MELPDMALSNEQELGGLIDKLEELLEKQLELARKGNIAQMESFANEAHVLIERMSEEKFAGSDCFEKRQDKLQQLYSEICLTLSSQMKGVNEELSRLHKGKKMVSIYRDNM